MGNIKNKIQYASPIQEFADSKIADVISRGIIKIFIGIAFVLLSMSLPILYILLHAIK